MGAGTAGHLPRAGPDDADAAPAMYPSGGASIPVPLPVPVSVPPPLAVQAPAALSVAPSGSLSVPPRPSGPVPVSVPAPASLLVPTPDPVPRPVQHPSPPFSVHSAAAHAVPLPVPFSIQPSSPWSGAASVPRPVQPSAPRAVGASGWTPSHPPPSVTVPPVPAHTPTQAPPFAVPLQLAAAVRVPAPAPALASPPAPQPVPRTPGAPAVLLSVPSLPSTPSAPRAAPPLTALAAAPAAVASPRPVPLANLSSATSPVHGSTVPVVPLPAPSLATQPRLSITQLTQPGAPLPVPVPTPASTSHASPIASPQPVASPFPSILVSSGPAPVPLNRTTTAPRSVTFALPADSRVAAAAPPPVGGVFAAPPVLPLAPTPVSVPKPVAVPTPTPVPVPVPTPTSVPQLAPTPMSVPRVVPQLAVSPLFAVLPVLRATEEEPAVEVVPLPAAEAEAHVRPPDYAAWLFPALLKGSALCTPALKYPLSDGAAPHVVLAPVVLRWSEEEVLAALPATLPPEYVIFGGARYSGAPLDLVRPPLVVAPNARRTAAFYEAAEDQRLQFLADQLEVARRYLKIEARRAAEPQRGGTSFPIPFITPGAGAGAGDVIVKPGESEDVAKPNIWTAAYFGSPQQLAAVLQKLKVDGALESAGLVSHRRRQWGLKRAGTTFELGLGMRGTPLQFAAAAGKLDSVVFLLASGARDRTAPRLKEILSPEAMQVVEAVCKPRSRAPLPARAPAAGAGDDGTAADPESAPERSQPPESSFMNVQVYDLDEGGRSPVA